MRRIMPFLSTCGLLPQRVGPLDEEICSLLAKRKELSDENPGFPDSDLISKWSQKFALNVNWLRRMFVVYLQGEECY
ncbi:hypothetical protein [Desulfosporosinus fructosivorans]|uniref:hypothetical protein n=1 Tax=Desulfosporosinus fructosivorans TaxID=2018669 RepID=UPI0018EEBBBA|nr:hypothetical protein [Desulfosporosinus fructosivorans]